VPLLGGQILVVVRVVHGVPVPLLLPAKPPRWVGP
jgi:hypothetical protein